MCNGTFDDERDDMTNFQYVGCTQNGMLTKPYSCPVCQNFMWDDKEIEPHFNKYHAAIKWKRMAVSDPRLPGWKFHFMIEDPANFIPLSTEVTKTNER